MSESKRDVKKIISGFIWDKISSIEYLQDLKKQVDRLQHYEQEKRIKSDYLNTLNELIQKDIIEINKELEDYLTKLLIK